MAAPTVNGYGHDPIIGAIRRLQPALTYEETQSLAKAIRQVNQDGCDIPWQILLSIAFHESSLNKKAVNRQTKDYGLMQISKANIERMGLDKNRLMKDEVYSLSVACTILTYNRDKYSTKIKHWLGIYRSGVALWKEKINKNAVEYDRMIRQTAARLGYKNAVRNLASGGSTHVKNN